MKPSTDVGVQRKLSETVSRVYRKFDEGFLTHPKAGPLFESILRSLYECVLGPGDIAIDVGANAGLHTVPMARAVSPGGRVYAFEPIPVVNASLAQRIASDKVEGVVRLAEVALSNRSGKAEFVVVEAGYGYSGLREKDYPFDPRKRLIEVDVDTLDRRIPATERIQFIKLDIEGGEFHALQGGVGLIRAHRPLIVLENAKQNSADGYGYTKDEFFALFAGLDYELRDILGCRISPEHWQWVGPWYTVACPRESGELVGDLLSACLAERLLGFQW